MNTKITIMIAGLFIGYFLIGFLLLFVVNKLSCLVFDEVLFDEEGGMIFVFLYPFVIPVVFILSIFYSVNCVVKCINNSILGYSEYYEEGEE